MRTQTDGSVITAVMKREFQTHKIITLSFALASFARNYGEVKINHTKIRT